MAEKIAIRDAFGEALLELGKKNDKVVALEADVGGSTKSAVFGKNGVFLLHQFLMKLGCFVPRARFHCHKSCNFSLFVSVIFLVVFAGAAGSKAEYQQEGGQYG